MKHHNIVIVCIDQGYSNIKNAQTVTATGIIKLDTEPITLYSLAFLEDLL